jgi:hypothetical protein
VVGLLRLYEAVDRPRVRKFSSWAKKAAAFLGSLSMYQESLRTEPVPVDREVVADLEDARGRAGVSCLRMVAMLDTMR